MNSSLETAIAPRVARKLTSVMNAQFTTIPIRCATCGQQTHKTLDAIEQNGGLICDCGAFTQIDAREFSKEIRKSETAITDFGTDG